MLYVDNWSHLIILKHVTEEVAEFGIGMFHGSGFHSASQFQHLGKLSQGYFYIDTDTRLESHFLLISHQSGCQQLISRSTLQTSLKSRFFLFYNMHQMALIQDPTDDMLHLVSIFDRIEFTIRTSLWWSEIPGLSQLNEFAQKRSPDGAYHHSDSL